MARLQGSERRRDQARAQGPAAREEARQTREMRLMWVTLHWRSKLPLYLAIFCTFATMGFLVDALTGGRYTLPWLAVLVAWSGVFAVGIARAVMSQQFIMAPVLVVAQILIMLFLPGRAEISSDTLAGRVTLDAAGVIILIIAGYNFFLYFIAREGTSAVRVRTEVALAREIHDELVPDVDLALNGYHAYGRATPANEVGGDLIDVTPGGHGLVAYLADVTGHGVPAGMLTGMTKAAARMRLRASVAPGELFDDLNAVLFPLKRPSMFVTCAAVLLDGGGRGTLALAGHPPVLRYVASSGRVERIGSPGLPLGVFETERYESQPLVFEPGDVLALISDGLMEVFDASDQEFGLDGIERVLAGHGRGPLPEICQAVFDAARAHGSQQDDQTLLLIRRIDHKG